MQLASSPIVATKVVSKVYPDGTRALKSVDFELLPGEIHGLLGENGAGKTTLAKILSGLFPPTEGELYVRGQRRRFRSPSEALREGIGMVHQHFTLVPVYNAIQNIVLGREGGGALSVLSLEAAREGTVRLMEETGLKVPPDTAIELLPVGVQQRVEILKLLYRNIDVLILDEPTSALTPLEVDTLFQMLASLKRAGKTTVFITHKLREVLEITDRITVLRHGEVAGRLLTKEATPDRLAELMVGMKSFPTIARKARPPGKPVLVVEGLRVRNDYGGLAAKDLSFEVRSGEIFGVAGVEGNGQTELVQAIAGLRPIEHGRIEVSGVDICRMTPRERYRTGMAHVPEDRRRTGLILDFTVAENSILGTHDEKKFRGRLDRLLWRRILEFASELVKRFGVVTPSLRTLAKNLSGGNQQRLVVARELVKAPTLIVISQPTRGLDIAATHYIRELLMRMRDDGKAILMVSADLDEVLQLSDRIAVMYEGRFMTVAEAEGLDRRSVGMMMGGVEAA